MPQETAKNSMRMRLILIPTGILLLGIVAMIAATLLDARTRIASEIRSGVELGDQLIGYALDELASSKDPEAALQRLRTGLSHVRHIKVAYQPLWPDAGASATQALDQKPEPRRLSSAPNWFLDLFEPARVQKTFPIATGARRGELVMSSEPTDEAAEIWASLVFLTALLTAISIVIVALILLTARHTLQPIHQLVEGLDRLGRGQFEALGEIRIAELRRIGEQFNRLAHSLARAEAENHLLIDRLLSIQDAERKELARELHDEFGASLFGIRAAASCIIEAAGAGAAAPKPQQEIIERAQTISVLADAIQKQNYRILERIRPVILHQMGLPDALRHLVASWRAQHREFACDLQIPDEIARRAPTFDEEVGLTSYRIVQECLTNAARHSKGASVRIAMDYRAGAGSMAEAPRLLLSIEDDGVGPPPALQFGFGLLGMSERVRKLGGCLKIGKGAHAGTLIEASIPVGPAPPST
ncbi:histidine kinase [Methylocapsa aurea]|uniref:histidine kinase n=1 Tax=Methylocapsa aurea TaxID=663610 RepID=UPI000562D19F|nr:histidine kinase [Methylocapsa aurea]